MEHSVLETITKVDEAFLFIFGISIAILVFLTVLTLWFLYRYNKKRNPVPTDIDGNVIAEVIWTVIPTLLVLAMFWYGWVGYKALRDVPENAMEVKVTARMWSWKFDYENGRSSSTLYVPENTPVKLDMTSIDVIHSLYIPAFRIKMDTVPGMQTYVWFNSGSGKAEYDIFCAEYCGTRHADMITKVVVVPKEEFDEWLESSGDTASVPAGFIALEKYGCLDCHSTDGSEIVGPSLKDLYGREVTVTENGKDKTITADEAYITKAIKEPSAEIVKGYDDMMPAEDAMTDEELKSIVEFIKGGLVMGVLGAQGAQVAENEGCLGCHSTDGSIIVGPSFKNMYGNSSTVVKGGKKIPVTLDRDYLINAIKNPDEEIAEGYDEGVMPPYELSDDDMDSLIEYIETLKD